MIKQAQNGACNDASHYNNRLEGEYCFLWTDINCFMIKNCSFDFHYCFSFEDIACLAESNSLSEVALDGNPFASEASYKQTVLRHMQQLRQLDMKRISVSLLFLLLLKFKVG